MEAASVPRLGAVSRTRGPSPALLRLAPDAQLVSLVRAGREDAFEAVYVRHRRGILAFCGRLLGDRDEAEDALQLTFMSAYNALLSDDRPVHLRPWLFAIARNRCYTMLRERRELATPDPAGSETLSESPATLVQRREDIRDLVADLGGLPEDQRAALVMAELGALSHDEIALALEIPRSKVKALVFQARESLTAARRARETDCAEIRRELSTLRGPALRRAHLRRHLHSCSSCQEYRRQLRPARGWAAAVLPAPLLGLRHLLVRAAATQDVLPAGARAGGGAMAAAVKLGAAKPVVGSLAALLGAAGAVAVASHVVHPPAHAGRTPVHALARVDRPAHTLVAVSAPHRTVVHTRHVIAPVRHGRPAAATGVAARPPVHRLAHRGSGGSAAHHVATVTTRVPAPRFGPAPWSPPAVAPAPASPPLAPTAGPTANSASAGPTANSASAGPTAPARASGDPAAAHGGTADPGARAKTLTDSHPANPEATPAPAPPAEHSSAPPEDRGQAAGAPPVTPTRPLLPAASDPTPRPVTPTAPAHPSITAGPRMRPRLTTTITRRSA